MTSNSGGSDGDSRSVAHGITSLARAGSLLGWFHPSDPGDSPWHVPRTSASNTPGGYGSGGRPPAACRSPNSVNERGSQPPRSTPGGGGSSRRRSPPHPTRPCSSRSASILRSVRMARRRLSASRSSYPIASASAAPPLPIRSGWDGSSPPWPIPSRGRTPDDLAPLRRPRLLLHEGRRYEEGLRWCFMMTSAPQ